MVVITAVFLLPYTLYNSYLYLFLQRPDLISFVSMGTIIPRPAVSFTDPRQVLIVGTISSGTSQVSADLKGKLGLEIGHENSETSWSFVRDGTVSWFHGIRYLPRPGIDTDDMGTAHGESLFRSVTEELCQELMPNMGFHPFMFRNGNCSLRQKWDNCWKQECKNIIEQEWGCGLRSRQKNSADGDGGVKVGCETPYRKSLLQVRHPMRTVESLVTKFCIGGVEGKVQPAFLTFTSALFPQHNFRDMSCIEVAGYYVVEYNNAILSANERGYLDARYQVEEATPCVVARLAGFMDGDVVYDMNSEHILNVCGDGDSTAHLPLTSNVNRYNKDLLSLDWDDLLGGRHGSRRGRGDQVLQKLIQKLTVNLGYESTGE